MNPRSASSDPGIPSLSRLRKGALAFAALTVAGLAGAFIMDALKETRTQLVSLHVGFLGLALASALADVTLGGLRFHLFIRRGHPRSPLWLPMRADLAGRFLGAVTPSATGGGPAQVFVLHRGGVPVPEALSLLLVNFISSLLVLLLAASLAGTAFRDRLQGTGLLPVIQSGLCLGLALLGAAVAALLRPELVARPLARLVRRPDGGPGSRPGLLQRVAALLVDSLGQYRVACRRFLLECPWLPAASFALTLGMYLNKFALAWLVLRGLGIEIDIMTTLALTALIHIGGFLVPSPGGSGIAELATGALLSLFLPGSPAGPFTLVYRMLLVYLPAVAGACVLLGEIDPRRGREPARAERATPAVLVLALVVGMAGTARADNRCPLCRTDGPVATPLLPAEMQAAAESLAARNRRQIDRIDAMLRGGRFGPPESNEARARARLVARLTLANWYSFLLPYVEDRERVRSVAPEVIAPIAARYCEAIAVPMPRLRELRLGAGHVCARYDLAGGEEEGWTIFGGRRLRYRVGERVVGAGRLRMVGLDWPSAEFGRIEVLVEEHYGFRLARTRLKEEDGSEGDLLLALDVRGGWVRRHGMHRPAAFAFWAMHPGAGATYLPHSPRVGAAIYLPGLRFKLPLLPDLELDDVRSLGLPMPFLDADDLRPGRLPPWLAPADHPGPPHWVGEGPFPPALRAYFPERRPSLAMGTEDSPRGTTRSP